MRSLLRPGGIALIGGDPSAPGGRALARNIDQLGCWARVRPVAVPGLPAGAWPDIVPIERLRGRMTTAFVVVEEDDAVVPAIGAAADHGFTSFFVLAGSTLERPGSRRLRDGLHRLRRAREVAIVGPGSPGIVDHVTGVAAYVGHVHHPREQPGRVSVVSQSGAILETMLGGGRFDLATAVGTGMECDVGLNDLLRFFADDEHTRTVLAFVEGVDDGAGFLRAARALRAAGTRLYVCRGGRRTTDGPGAVTHTGQAAGSAQVWSAVLRDVGAVECASVEGLIAAGDAVGSGAERYGRRVHVVAYSGAEARLFVNEGEQVGLEFPPLAGAGLARLRHRWPTFPTANPVDPWDWDRSVDRAYGLALDAVGREAGDVIALVMGLQSDHPEWLVALAVALTRLGGQQGLRSGRPVVLVNPVAEEPHPDVRRVCDAYGVPLLKGAGVAAEVLAGLAERTGPSARPAAQVGLLGGGRLLPEAAAWAFLGQRGISAPPQVVTDSFAGARTAAAALGYPVAVKRLLEGTAHKRSHGLVQSAISDEATLARAWGHLSDDHREDRGAGAQYLVQQHVLGEMEILVGARRDPAFGVVGVVGPGGTGVRDGEGLLLHQGADAAYPSPDTPVLAAVRRLREGARLAAALGALARSVAAAVSEHEDVLEIELNPVIVGDRGVLPVDVCVRVG